MRISYKQSQWSLYITLILVIWLMVLPHSLLNRDHQYKASFINYQNIHFIVLLFSWYLHLNQSYIFYTNMYPSFGSKWWNFQGSWQQGGETWTSVDYHISHQLNRCLKSCTKIFQIASFLRPEGSDFPKISF